MPILDLKRLEAHRARSFHLPPAARLKSEAQALGFINRRGYVYFWPIKGVDLPSLWIAVAGDRPVADKHDDPGHVTWRWKDGALHKRLWYYAKVLRRKATMISLEVAPYFYALSDNYGSPEEDYLAAYEEGRLTAAAKQVYEALLKEGALDTISLRKAARLSSGNSDAEFNRAVDVLQADFKILPVGIAEAGAWKYAHIYEIVARHYPDLPDRARKIGEAEARARLLELYFESVGAAQARDAVKLLGWSGELTARTLNHLAERDLICPASHPSKPGKWYGLSAVCGRS